jgi:hypothetical protein
MCRRIIMLGLIVAMFLGIWPATLCLCDFDREACEQACRTRYMGLGVFKDDGSDYALMSLDSCMQDCNRQFWEDFDAKSSDLERAGKRGAQ